MFYQKLDSTTWRVKILNKFWIFSNLLHVLELANNLDKTVVSVNKFFKRLLHIRPYNEILSKKAYVKYTMIVWRLLQDNLREK